jgi:hypothetical protein
MHNTLALIKDIRVIRQTENRVKIQCDFGGVTHKLWVSQEWLEEHHDNYTRPSRSTKRGNYPSHYIP